MNERARNWSFLNFANFHIILQERFMKIWMTFESNSMKFPTASDCWRWLVYSSCSYYIDGDITDNTIIWPNNRCHFLFVYTDSCFQKGRQLKGNRSENVKIRFRKFMPPRKIFFLVFVIYRFTDSSMKIWSIRIPKSGVKMLYSW